MLVFFIACKKQPTADLGIATNDLAKAGLGQSIAAAALVTTSENFETGTKAAYAAADVSLTTGVWNLNDALLGNTTSDKKNGTQSARVRNSGKLTMKFNLTNGAATVTVLHAKYGTDANSTWQLWYSTNGGTSYTQTGATITTSSATLTSTAFTENIAV